MMPRPKKHRIPEHGWAAGERAIFEKLKNPHAIQEFLDSLPYSAESRYRSPRSVISDRKAHCFDGAVFAAAALRMIGDPPVIVDMHSVRDDDHVIAIFRRRGRVGAIAKSNFAGLRFREPVYRDIRELIMSYFESFYNIDREKTLRRFTIPVDLSAFDKFGWMVQDSALDRIVDRLNVVRTSPILTPAMIRALHPVDSRTYRAGLAGANRHGLYKP